MLCISACWLQGCGQSSAEVEQARPRPVTTFPLKRTAPTPEARHAASVTPWKSQDFGFEVGGRVVEMLVEPGEDVAGPEIDPDSTRFKPRTGTLVGRLDPQRFEARLNSAKASVATAQARILAIEREIENVIPKQVAASQATLVLARQEFQRAETLRRQNVTTQAELDKVQADMDTAEAQLQQLEANIAVREAELAAQQAQLAEAREAVRQAQQDLDDTGLYAPFQGQISHVYETVGSVVQAGQAVARVQMMDPIQVDVQVSAETDARLFYNDMVLVYPSDGTDPVPAMVYEKAALADDSTRTFLVTLLIRNRQMQYGMPEEFDADRDVRTRDVGRIFVKHEQGRPRYYVRESGLYRDETGEYVWRVNENVQRIPEGDRPYQLEVEQVRVKSGSERMAFLSVAVFRELEDIGELNPAADAIIGSVLTMAGRPLTPEEATQRLTDKGMVYWTRERWMFRPGDVAEVDLRAAPSPLGFYVPMEALVLNPADEQDVSVFIVQERKAIQVPVKLIGPPIGSQRQIEPVHPDALSEGDLVISQGVHFLIDGEAVLPRASSLTP